jgi:glycosyltransferase involved in cell wall biosynthesis
MQNLEKIDVIMSVYEGSEPKEVYAALNSIINQSVKPSNFFVCVDGPICLNIRNVLDEFSNKKLITLVISEENVGRGEARNIAAREGTSEIIALMDADDISRHNRLELQLKYMKKNNLDICGAYIEEFREVVGDIGKIRKTPVLHNDIANLIFLRNPINHVTMLVNRRLFERIGGYKKLNYVEDWDFMLRAVSDGANCGNLSLTLVDVRCNLDKRIRTSYFLEEVFILVNARRIGLLSISHLIPSLIIRFFKLILPKNILKIIYKYLRVSKR